MEPETTKDDTIKVQEYLDISNTIRHYSNLQFAQMTLFIAISGGLFVFLVGETSASSHWLRMMFEWGGIGAGLMFLMMSRRVGEYWDARVARAKEIEKELSFAQYKNTPPRRYIRNRAAVAVVYWLIILVYLTLFICDLAAIVCTI